MTRTTLTVTEAARLVGIGRTAAYAAASAGEIAGVKVLRIRRRMVLPTRPLADVLGLTLDDVERVLADVSRETDPSAAWA